MHNKCETSLISLSSFTWKHLMHNECETSLSCFTWAHLVHYKCKNPCFLSLVPMYQDIGVCLQVAWVVPFPLSSLPLFFAGCSSCAVCTDIVSLHVSACFLGCVVSTVIASWFFLLLVAWVVLSALSSFPGVSLQFAWVVLSVLSSSPGC